MSDSVVDGDRNTIITVPSIPDVIYDALRRDISRGLYPPGRISIRQLAVDFGVSAMPVREALRRLQAEGLVSFKGGRQVVIEELILDDLIELFAIRSELESLAMRHAVPALSGDARQLGDLERLINAMDGEEDSYDRWRDLNRQLHQSLYAAAAMPRLLATVESLGIAVEPYARAFGGSVAGLRLAQEQHRAILERVRENDAVAASVVLREHLESALDVLRRAASDGTLATERNPPKAGR